MNRFRIIIVYEKLGDYCKITFIRLVVRFRKRRSTSNRRNE